MSVYLFTNLFYLLLFLLMCVSLLCEHVSATRAGKQGLDAAKTIELFKTTYDLTSAKGPNGEQLAKKDVDVKDFYSPVIVPAGDYVVAFAGVNRIDKTEKKINILTNYTEKNNLFGNKDVLNFENGWETQIAVHNNEIEEIEKVDEVVKGLLAVAKGNEIYLLSIICKKEKGDLNSFDFALYFVDGTVKKNSKKIEWNKNKLTAATLAEKFKTKFSEKQEGDFLFSGLAFLIGENIVFALNVEKAGKTITALINLRIETQKSELVDTKIFEDCQPYFFPWGKKIMMISANCQTENTKEKIIESNNIGGAWNDSKETFFGLYEFLKNKQTFVTIENETKEILLFTEHIKQTAGGTNVNLWMSDGTRLKNIGEIVAVGEKVTPVNFLFAEGKLFSLDRQPQDGSEITSVSLKYLKDQSTLVISTINAWKNADDKILELCDGEESSKIPCFTNGLIGFLFSTEKSTNKWNDEYNNANAILNTKGGEKEQATETQSGFTFTGQGAGATWPVGEQSENQPYSFTNSGFTLVATVKIENNNKNKIDNSLLGLVLKTGKKPIGLWCRTGIQWAVSDIKNNFKDSTLECKEGKTYSVALVLSTGKISVYVDWEQLPGLDGSAIQIESSEQNTRFYFGTDSSTQTSDNTDVTITNVLLYNRQFTEAEIKNLQAKAKQNNAADTQTQHESDTDNLPKTGDSTTQTDRPVETPATQIATENEEAVQSSSSPPPTAEDNAVRVGVVGCCALCCLVCSHCWGVMCTDTTTITTVLYIYIFICVWYK